MKDNFLELLNTFIDKKDILTGEPMSKHTSFKIGGKADYFVIVRDIETLKKLQEITKQNNIPLFILGNGSNILVLDEGIKGVVAKLKFDKIDIKKEKVTVSSDVLDTKLARICADKGLSGLEFLCGIPRNYWGSSKNECRSLWRRDKRYFS